ncbi:UDP-3-O-acyl-N-acetylglucosamine deacetylase [Kovacikia minuta CCNUW1]|uniref:UDP-3-O-acyl-N-acetylglucosamine deacetylase n=1 Tax=Kovacikia minuta TaxID=2931930 RepID=UPI001CCA3090|nr:UDP-3-O-acyl-N-acetylglucosamine deacetylase [Kovacikia minuta]UBF27384.1 UDP-3-O-acyl-N-acetylglucosamine deacetylase [Kovacikia minuta CCNUW1]
MEVEVRGQQPGVRSQESEAESQELKGALGQFQQTLEREFVCSGVGLHTGASVQVRILPAPVGRGRYFVRVDLPETPEIPASIEAVSQTALSTELTQGEARVRTVEHLLAALTGMGVDNARIELDGPEVPLLDGSAKEWVEAIAQAGILPQTELRPLRTIHQPVWIRDQDAFVAALPATETRFTYGIDFELPAIGNQWHSWSPTGQATFETEIAPARTFGLLHQIDYLRQQGLIKGGSLDNALVCGSDGWLNPPLRFANEPARHKLLDLVGDLSLLGEVPTAHFLAYKASHNLHTQLARSLKSLSAHLLKI